MWWQSRPRAAQALPLHRPAAFQRLPAASSSRFARLPQLQWLLEEQDCLEGVGGDTDDEMAAELPQLHSASALPQQPTAWRAGLPVAQRHQPAAAPAPQQQRPTGQQALQQPPEVRDPRIGSSAAATVETAAAPAAASTGVIALAAQEHARQQQHGVLDVHGAEQVWLLHLLGNVSHLMTH